MKQFFILIFLFSVGNLNCQNTVHSDSVIYNYEDKVNYLRGEPYTGISTKHHSNGQLQNEFNYKDGKWHGLMRIWFENGQLSHEYNCKNGVNNVS